MQTAEISNANDFKVVELFNNTDFDFTSELGCMYDGRPLFVASGERKQFPYHVGQLLARNLAKACMIKGAPTDVASTNPTGAVIWSVEKLEAVKNSFLTELYTEEKAIPQSETDRLMQRVSELEKLFQQKQAEKPIDAPREEVKSAVDIINKDYSIPETSKQEESAKKIYMDKGEVIAELEKRGIIHDKRASKVNLEKLLA